MGKSWEIDAEGAAVSWPYVSLHCPEIHTYSHTQRFTKINCVIPALPSQRERSQVAGLGPDRVSRDRQLPGDLRARN
jgi:hypothetical protein